jgi:hypothetical protein
MKNSTLSLTLMMAALCAGAASAGEPRTVIDAPRGRTVITQQRGADGAIDATRTRPDGSTVTIDRQRP